MADKFIEAIRNNDPSLLPKPITRLDRFKHSVVSGMETPKPITSEERYYVALRDAVASRSGSTESKPIDRAHADLPDFEVSPLDVGHSKS